MGNPFCCVEAASLWGEEDGFSGDVDFSGDDFCGACLTGEDILLGEGDLDDIIGKRVLVAKGLLS